MAPQGWLIEKFVGSRKYFDKPNQGVAHACLKTLKNIGKGSARVLMSKINQMYTRYINFLHLSYCIRYERDAWSCRRVIDLHTFWCKKRKYCNRIIVKIFYAHTQKIGQVKVALAFWCLELTKCTCILGTLISYTYLTICTVEVWEWISNLIP